MGGNFPQLDTPADNLGDRRATGREEARVPHATVGPYVTAVAIILSFPLIRFLQAS